MYKLYSQRKKEAEQGISDVYIYDKFCRAFRNQYLHIVEDVFGIYPDVKYIYKPNGKNIDMWEFVCQAYAREKGLKYLQERHSGDTNTYEAYEDYVDDSDDSDFLDLLDFTFTEIISNKRIVGPEYGQVVSLAIKELNYRFKQHSLGYEFINGKLIPKTNEFIHAEIIKPALHLLNNKIFEGAEQEYFQAFEHYKKGQSKDAILNAIKAFESVLKSICQEMKYPYDRERDTAKQLLQHLTDNGFYPKYLESHLNGIRSTLESGAPTMRNKNAGHGQGQEVIDVSDEYVEYALNLVATNIVLLVKIFNGKKGI